MSLDNLRDHLNAPIVWGVTLTASAVGAYLLWTHTGHVLSAIPYVILLACPLMHLFGHRHGHSHRQEHANDR